MTSDWQVFPTSSWNYSLNVSAEEPNKGIDVMETEIAGNPFSRRHTPVRLVVKARKLNEWRAEDGASNPLPQSPVDCDALQERIELIPYAAAKLRITAFPVCRR
jgi:hypothetical protein